MQNVGTSVIRERLGEARVRLEGLDRERSWSGNPLLGKAVENRIVWRELLDLELQDIDQQMERICGATQSISGCREAPAAQKRSEPK
jgi:hypothetical protein